MSGDRAGRAVRQQLRAERLDALRRSWWLMVALGAWLAVVGWGLSWSASPAQTWFTAGVLTATWFGVFGWAIVSVSDTGSRMTGLHAEGWTAERLRKARRGGWRAVHGVPLDRGDVDHIVVGPGGAFAIETKWCQRWDGRRWAQEHLRRGAGQARAGARRAWAMLYSVGIRTEVTPIVVVWGRTDRLPSEVDGVPVVHGSDLRRWLEELPGESLTAEEVRRAKRELESMAQTWEETLRQREDPQPLLVGLGPVAVVRRVGLGVGAGVAALPLMSEAVKVADRWMPFAAAVAVVAAAMGAPALAACRSERFRPVGTGVLTGVVGLTLVAGAVVVYASLLG